MFKKSWMPLMKKKILLLEWICLNQVFLVPYLFLSNFWSFFKSWDITISKILFEAWLYKCRFPIKWTGVFTYIIRWMIHSILFYLGKESQRKLKGSVNKVFSLWKKLFPHLKDHGKGEFLLTSFFDTTIAHLKISCEAAHHQTSGSTVQDRSN